MLMLVNDLRLLPCSHLDFNHHHDTASFDGQHNAQPALYLSTFHNATT